MVNWPHPCLKIQILQKKVLKMSQLPSWMTKRVLRPFRISAGGHFHIWICSQKWNHICGSCFSNFSFCLDAIFTSWICSQCHIVFVGAVFFYLFNAIIIMPGKQLQSTYFLSLAATDSMWIFSLFRHHLSLKIIWKYVPPGSYADDQEEVASDLNNVAELIASNKYNTGLKHDPMSLMSPVNRTAVPWPTTCQ